METLVATADATQNTINSVDFTIFVAIFAATLAAVNIFNAHLARPFILTPLENQVKKGMDKCLSVRPGLRLLYSKAKIDEKIKHLNYLLFSVKLVIFIYNIIVLCCWGYYSWQLLLSKFTFKQAEFFLWIVSISSVVVVILGIVAYGCLYCISSTDDIQEEDVKNIKAIMTEIGNKKTQSENIS